MIWASRKTPLPLERLACFFFFSLLSDFSLLAIDINHLFNCIIQSLREGLVIDSTGDRGRYDVSCVFCATSLLIPMYTPRFGHGGEPLSPRTFFDFGSGDGWLRYDLEIGSIFVLHRAADLQWRLEPWPIATSSLALYAPYGMAEAPKFGLGEGLAVYLCGHCSGAAGMDRDKVLEALQKKCLMWEQFIKT